MTSPRAARVAVYARVSTLDQEVQNQVAEIHRAATEKGWQIVGDYMDVGVKGDESKPELQRLLRDAHIGRFDRVCFWSLDRLSRSGPLEALQTLDLFNRQGVAYWSYSEVYLDTEHPFHGSLTAFTADIAHFEKSRLIERIRAGQARARDSGKHLGRPKADLRGHTPQGLARERASGLSWAQIAAKTGLSTGTVRRAVALAKSMPEVEG